jgi:hypothetical protein
MRAMPRVARIRQVEASQTWTQEGSDDSSPGIRGGSFHDLAFEFTGLCDAGIEIVANAAGVEPWTAINLHTVMAQGSQGKSRGISHLDFEAIGAAEEDPVAACS